jgi:hypothetical protein
MKRSKFPGSNPKPFGFRIWKGIRRRLAKKMINRYGRDMWARLHEFGGFRPGDLIRTCSGFNARAEEVFPVYAYTKRGYALIDLDFEGMYCGCSMFGCGASPPATYEELVKYKEDSIRMYESRGDEWGIAERMKRTTINPDGTVKVEDAPNQNQS